LQGVKEQIESTRLEIEQAERRAELEKVARLRYGTLRELEGRLADGERRLKDIQKEGALLK
jgi:ATP-dependent Clp protease ATP-binding subunit ClpB